MKNLEPMGRLIGQTLAGLGLGRLDVVLALLDEWESVVPEPWCSHSRPAYLRDGELMVEAASPQAVSLLRYAVGDLLRTLDERFGEGVVLSVRVQSRSPGTSADDG